MITYGYFPSLTNQAGKRYLYVNSEGHVDTLISAPDAGYVELDIGGVKYDIVQDDQGVWTGESGAQDWGIIIIR